jgi:molybdenum cofactor biosynthesis protein A
LSSLLFDNHGRTINYVRLAVTDRCNLRCYYCMPEEGIEYIPRTALMNYEEMVRMMQIMGVMGIQKVRITGGEPFVRRDLMDFIRTLSEINGINEIAITTNGTLTAPHLPELKKLGIKSINLSLDSLDRARFFEITRRDEFDQVWKTFQTMLDLGIKVKLNSVVTEGKNEADLLPMVELTKNYPVSVRFIEEMPFNGSGNHHERLHWDWQRIHNLIKTNYPSLYKLPDPLNSTAYHYGIPGHQGNIGIIAAYSRTFCGTCNRIRITPQGGLKTCLYDEGVFNIKDLMRAGATNEQVKIAILEALGSRSKDGHEAEARRFFGNSVHESMTTIGG